MFEFRASHDGLGMPPTERFYRPTTATTLDTKQVRFCGAAVRFKINIASVFSDPDPQ